VISQFALAASTNLAKNTTIERNATDLPVPNRRLNLSR
jgi:hypothetical protein